MVAHAPSECGDALTVREANVWSVVVVLLVLVCVTLLVYDLVLPNETIRSVFAVQIKPQNAL